MSSIPGRRYTSCWATTSCSGRNGAGEAPRAAPEDRTKAAVAAARKNMGTSWSDTSAFRSGFTPDGARPEGPSPRSASHGGLAGPEEAFLCHFLGNRRRELGDEAFDLRRVEGPTDSRPDELVLFERVDQGLDLHDLVCPQVGGRIDRPPSPSPVPAPEMGVVGTGPDAGLVCELRLASDDAHDDRAGESELLGLGFGRVAVLDLRVGEEGVRRDSLGSAGGDLPGHG